MIVVMEPDAPKEDFEKVVARIQELGYKVHPIHGVERTVIGCVGHEDKTPLQSLETMRSVEAVIPILRPFKLVSREWKKEQTVLDIGGVKIGGENLVVMAGPCSIENEESLETIAQSVKASGAHFLRGGAYKPRSSPYSFQGLEEEGLRIMREAADRHGLKMVTELVSTKDIDAICKYTDMIQIGARNAQNFALLRAAGKSGVPVLLKRGFAMTSEEFLMAAEYLLSEGNPNVVLCERGIRTFEKATRFTLDLSIIPVVRELSHLPIIIDPSHATGHWHYVEPMALAAVAAGADGLMIEVHPDPSNAMSDGAQSLKPRTFARVMEKIGKIAPSVDRKLSPNS
ncbi:MAG: 3-deoxy-7-phosphoheptulonate synthase, partial [Candidatus Sumerlaeota bacterium]